MKTKSKKIYSLCFALIIAVLLSSCKKDDSSDDDNNNNTNNAVTIDSDVQFTGTINGTNVSILLSNIGDAVTGADNHIAAIPDTSYFKYDTYLSKNDNSLAIQIKKGTLKSITGYPDNTTFQAFFTAGNYSYSVDAFNGIEISYWDANQKEWSTSMGSANQSGKTFTIDAARDDGNGYVKIKASFSCNLYDASGNSITLTNGVFVDQFCNM
ncbi:MAG TPA: hypothetical protein PKK00_13715 [Bacteroidales bacterium]|nr:hypothetical protein [Bacteroidales bacterium]HPS18246.1 hypothetical protein [Bacteroidales bacterium]